ncbi:hypothetical protein G3A43_43985 [Paraburkholderia aspalathi]|uniref:hypothetical protein n=1 Tax=Paraburkholderia nemoris TaxID=2793076 RepID=UPI00190D167D|nr:MULTISPECIES: hypothetical protein [Paraburkholderia]MBK3787120.1 hypothetical protein [Paraburkholderia aspalathi]
MSAAMFLAVTGFSQLSRPLSGRRTDFGFDLLSREAGAGCALSAVSGGMFFFIWEVLRVLTPLLHKSNLKAKVVL